MPPARRRASDGDDAAKRPQDPLVERLRPDPSEPAQPVIVLEGLLGDSDRNGFRRLYLTRALDYYAEFRAADVIDIQTIEPDQPPFLGETASRVTLPRDAQIDFTRSAPARAADEFDLDVRLGPGFEIPIPDTIILTDTCRFLCDLKTRISPCRTEGGFPCIETRIRTRCETCATCETRCGTCETCATRCDTCVRTCDTCATRCDTCVTCATRCDTCIRTQCDTCARTICGGCITQDRTCDTCGIACTAVGCQTQQCTIDTCGIACTAVRCDTLVC